MPHMQPGEPQYWDTDSAFATDKSADIKEQQLCFS